MKFIILLFLVSCGTVSTYDKNKVYKKDLKLEINGQKATGMMVIPIAPKYDIEAIAKDEIKLFTLRNCHRSVEIEDGWVKSNLIDKLKKKKVRLEITPNSPIETSEYCPIDLGSWSLSGRHSWGWIDFYTGGKYILPAMLKCNGELNNVNGVSVCQAFSGMYQEIVFNKDVEILSGNKECELGLQTGKIFRFKIKKGLCVYGFRDPISKKRHRLTTHGYIDIILEN